MKVIKDGYLYETDDGQVIRFAGGGAEGGAKAEEIVAILRDRFVVQHRQVPGRHTGPVVQLLDKVMAYMDARAGLRAAMGLTGTLDSHDPIVMNDG